MGRINNGNWVSQHRKSQGKFLEKQDIEAYLFSKKLNNGNNIQEKNTLNTDDLPNIPAILDYELNLSRQNSIEPIDGGKAHTPITQVLLPVLTALSATSPNIVSSKKAISTDNPNSLSNTVKNFTEISKTPVLFDTTFATTLTSQNHDRSKEPTKHDDDQSIIRVKRAVGDHYTLYFNKLNYIHLLEQKFENDIIGLYLFDVEIDLQKAQEIGEILKGSKVKVLSLVNNQIGEAIDFGTMLTDTEVTTLNLAYSEIGNERAIALIKSLKKGDTKVKVVKLAYNNISDKGANDLISELTDSQIIEVDLMGNIDIKPETSKKLLKVLEHNRHVNEESYTSTMESSTTEEESSKDIYHTGKREKRDIHTTNEPLPKEKSTASTPEESTVTITDVSSTTTTESIASSTSTTAKEETITEQETTVPTMDGSSTTTTKSTTSSTEGSTTTEQEITASSAGNPTTDSTTEKPTPKESNPNNPASSTMSIGEILGLISFALTTIGAVGGTVGWGIKKFCGGVSHLGHEALALAELALVELDNRLDNNGDTSLTGVTVNGHIDG
ncbi:MAG: hypothetical protein ACEY3E_05660 [Candidatus Tisiphia sp.]